MGLREFLDKTFDFQLITDGCEGLEDFTAYLKRWFIIHDNKGPKKTWHVYLHNMLRSDADKELHDHPWWFISIILWGGYWEETERGREFLRPGRIIFRPAAWRHRVHLPEGRQSWSLVLTGVKERSWGFWTETGFVGWREWGKLKCAERLRSLRQPSGTLSVTTT
jgi:hypothetical protein